MLEDAGLSAIEDRLYRALVAAPSASPHELDEILGHPPGGTRRALRRLEDLGLVSRTPDEPPRYVAAPPDVAIEPLILTQQVRLERARAHAAQLMGVYRSARDDRRAGELVEVVEGRETINHRFTQLQRAARSQVRAFVMPPFFTDGTDHEHFRDAEMEQLGRGVRYRVVYDHAGFSAQGGLEAMLSDVAAGEEVRIAEQLPIKLFLVDDTLAFVPMTRADDDREPGAVVVHPSGLLSGLVALFEQVWERAAPFALAHDRRGGVAEPILDNDSRRLLTMLRAGFADVAIARHLGTSPRTMQRRIRVLMDAAAVETRFQLGARATELGWFDRHPVAGPAMPSGGNRPMGMQLRLDATDSVEARVSAPDDEGR